MDTFSSQAFTVLILCFALLVLANDVSTKEYIIFPIYGLRSQEEVDAVTHYIKYHAERHSIYSELSRGSTIPLFWTARLPAESFEEMRRSPVVSCQPKSSLT